MSSLKIFYLVSIVICFIISAVFFIVAFVFRKKDKTKEFLERVKFSKTIILLFISGLTFALIDVAFLIVILLS